MPYALNTMDIQVKMVLKQRKQELKFRKKNLKYRIQNILKQLNLQEEININQYLEKQQLQLQELQVNQAKIIGDRIMVQRVAELKEIQQKVQFVGERIKKLNNIIELQISLNEKQDQIFQFYKQMLE
ncbi:unnamed protein product [Paramecium sonneborni]|uniref:Uncharacterized protein n=1 Tax=Paramecium sonneborni TaxID=65129 RepID=A0A8S1MQ13_9CILI|nr:unnamed protein product [Paramecium sonneborni]